MPIRKTIIASNEYYHICNRSNDKQNIFIENKDWIRFLFLMLYSQSPENFSNLSRPVSHFVKHLVFNITKDKTNKITENRKVELIAFSLMPNHFHILIQQLKEKGISKYMQRIQNAYAKYFNAKYEKSGHLFHGPYQIVHIKNNEQLLYLSAYINRNMREIKEWKNNEEKYPWSSYQDYLYENRWEDLLKPNIVLGQFANPKEYEKFVETSGAKTELDEKLLLDFD